MESPSHVRNGIPFTGNTWDHVPEFIILFPPVVELDRGVVPDMIKKHLGGILPLNIDEKFNYSLQSVRCHLA